ncbi:hypothetical protein [Roseovarius indicus]|uniref:hypothetical protein n=1 Tax=Roseovarius indicus TaxID=540747 RepID=UPI000941D616|nr:hypothetical protein [Roseovarius indicus]
MLTLEVDEVDALTVAEGVDGDELAPGFRSIPESDFVHPFMSDDGSTCPGRSGLYGHVDAGRIMAAKSGWWKSVILPILPKVNLKSAA